MRDEGSQERHDEAQVMLDAFGSVGATQFDVTWTNCVGTKEGFRRGARFDDLARALPALLDGAAGKRRNLIVRPHGRGVTFTQLDDLAPAVFLTLQTSPGNFQAWIAMDGADNKDFARRLGKGTGADATASGATRVAGGLNFKDKYAPNFPRVAIDQANLGRKTTTAALERLGLVAPPESPALPQSTPHRMQARAGNRKWPRSTRCVEGAPLEGDKSGPDISRADFVWCMTAISWGWSVDATAARLLQEIGKAQENGEGYAALTARNASAAVERGRGQPPIYELGAIEQI